MPISLSCPGCRAAFEVPDALAGKTIRCTACKTQLTVPPAAAPAGRKPFGWAANPAPEPPPAAVPVKPTPIPAAPARPARGRDVDDRPRPRRRFDEDDDSDDDRPRRRRKGNAGPVVAVAAVVVGLAAAAAGYFVVMGLAGKKADEAADAGGPAPAAEAKKGGGGRAAAPLPPLPGGWQRVQCDGFSVGMPTAPRAEPLPAGGTRWKYDTPTLGLVALAVPLSPPERPRSPATGPQDVRRFADQLVRNFGQHDGLREQGEPRLQYQDGFPGSSRQLTTINRAAGGAALVVLVDNSKLVCVMGIGPGLTAASPEIKQFFDTLRIGSGTEPAPASPPAPTPPPVTADSWQRFEGEGFAAAMPAAPTSRSVPNGRQYTMTLYDGGREVIFVAESTRLRPNEVPRNPGEVANTLNAVSNGLTRQFTLRMPSLVRRHDRDITVGGFPGREQFHATPGGAREPEGLVVRAVLAGDRLFVTIVAGSQVTPDTPPATTFHESFKITPTPDGPPGGSAPAPDRGPVAGKPPGDDPPPMPPAGAAGGMPAEWATFTGDGFTAEMPGTPQVLGTLPADRAAFGVQMYVLRTPDIRGTYHVNVSAVAPGVAQIWATNPAAAADTLDAALGVLKKRPGEAAPGVGRTLEIKEIKDITAGGFRGREVRLGGKGSGLFRAIVVGNRTYTYGAAHDSDPEFITRAERMADSFKVTYSPPAGGGGNMARPPAAPVAGEVSPEPAARLQPFFCAAYDPEAKELYTVGPRDGAGRGAGTLTRYGLPEFKKLGEYLLPAIATRAVLDPKAGRLYLATPAATGKGVPDHRPNMAERIDAAANVTVFDLAPVRAGKLELLAQLKPAATVTVGSFIVGMELAADGSALYVATALLTAKPSSELLAIDPATQKVAKRMPLPEPVGDLRSAADGSGLLLPGMPFGPNGRLVPTKTVGLLVVDPVKWAKAKTAALPPGVVVDLTAGPDGKLVAAVVIPAGPGMLQSRKLYLLDPDGGPRELPLGIGGAANGGYARLSPDGKRLYVSSRQADGLDVYEMADPVPAAGLRKLASVRKAGDLRVGGNFTLAPDGKYVVFQTGAVLDADALAADAPIVPGRVKLP